MLALPPIPEGLRRGFGKSRALDHFDIGHGNGPRCPDFGRIRLAADASFWAAVRRLASAIIQLAPAKIAWLALGTRAWDFFFSTTSCRSCTSSSGMSIRTGHTSKHAPHKLDA